MELWDNNTCTKMKIHLREAYQQYNNRHYFKGMEMDNDTRLEIKGIWYEVDFYGLDTKKTLSLDRKKVKKEALKQIQKILDSAIQFYIEAMEDVLFAKKEKRTEIEYDQIYTYWCMCSLKMKIELLSKYKEIFESIPLDVDVLKKNGSVYENVKVDFKQVMSNLNDMVTIKNLSNFIENKTSKESINIELIKNILDTQEVTFSIVVVDKNFTEVLDFPYSENVAIVSSEDNYIYLIVHSVETNKLPYALDDKSKIFLLSSMFKRNKSTRRYGFVSPSMRKYIMGIADYETICTPVVPFGVAGEGYRSIGYIIAPFTVEQWENNKHLSIDEFEKTICGSKEFQNLVNHVSEHQLRESKCSKEDIRKGYVDLIRDLYNNTKRL